MPKPRQILEIKQHYVNQMKNINTETNNVK